MYFYDFDFGDPGMTETQMRFITDLSAVLKQYNLRQDQVESQKKLDNKEEYFEIKILHKTEQNYNLCIALTATGVIVFFADAHYHFDKFSTDDNWLSEAVRFILHIMQGKMEVHTYYKGNKIFKELIYYCNDDAKKEVVSSSYNFNRALFNPFAKVKVRAVTISYI